jgi:hypothetical protein
MPTVTLTTASTSPWTSPITGTVRVRMWGGGGKGGDRSTNGGSGGGGGGAFSELTEYSVTKDSTYAFVVGAGATGTDPGGDTYWVNTSTGLAKGGGSVANNTITGGTAGAAASGVGTVKYSGGDGGTSGGTDGASGGSSAGYGADGTAGVDGGGRNTGPDGSGYGGAYLGTNVDGEPGGIPGGGGGGVRRSGGGATHLGGEGANGLIEIFYEETAVNDDGTGSVDDVSLTVPTGTSTGYATTSNAINAVSLITPAGTATGAASTTGAVESTSLEPPVATSSGAADTTGEVQSVTLSTVSGSASGGEVINDSGSGSIVSSSLVAPTARVILFNLGRIKNPSSTSGTQKLRTISGTKFFTTTTETVRYGTDSITQVTSVSRTSKKYDTVGD